MFKRFTSWLYRFLGFNDFHDAQSLILQMQLNNTLLELSLWKHRAQDPRYIASQCFEKGIKWYDWNDEKHLKPEIRRKNWTDAQMFLESGLFSNIKNYLIATGAQTALLEEQHDTDKIRDFQMTINGLELLWDEIKGIKNPDAQKEQVEDPYSGI